MSRFFVLFGLMACGSLPHAETEGEVDTLMERVEGWDLADRMGWGTHANRGHHADQFDLEITGRETVGWFLAVEGDYTVRLTATSDSGERWVMHHLSEAGSEDPGLERAGVELGEHGATEFLIYEAMEYENRTYIEVFGFQFPEASSDDVHHLTITVDLEEQVQSSAGWVRYRPLEVLQPGDVVEGTLQLGERRRLLIPGGGVRGLEVVGFDMQTLDWMPWTEVCHAQKTANVEIREIPEDEGHSEHVTVDLLDVVDGTVSMATTVDEDAYLLVDLVGCHPEGSDYRHQVTGD